MHNKCLIWDFDNTLAMRNGMWTQSLCNVLNNNGYMRFNREKLSESFSSDFPWHKHEEAHSAYFEGLQWWDYIYTLVNRALLSIGMTDSVENLKLMGEMKTEYLRLSEWKLYEDTMPTLKHSKAKGYTNIILSNHVPELAVLVDGLGIAPFFDRVISSANVGFDKPNPMIFEEVLRKHKHDAYYMIGDSYQADILGAMNVGITGILVRKNNIQNYEKYAQDLFGIWKYIE